MVAAALDPDAPDGPLRVAGDSRSPSDLVDIATRATGREFALHQIGTLEDLKHQIDRRQGEAPQDPNAWVSLQYFRSMASGVGQLNDLHNDRYPHIDPMGVETLLAAQHPSARTQGDLTNAPPEEEAR